MYNLIKKKYNSVHATYNFIHTLYTITIYFHTFIRLHAFTWRAQGKKWTLVFLNQVYYFLFLNHVGQLIVIDRWVEYVSKRMSIDIAFTLSQCKTTCSKMEKSLCLLPLLLHVKTMLRDGESDEIATFYPTLSRK